MDELDDTANTILQRDRFDEAFDDSDSEDESSEEEGYSSDEDSSDSSDSESEGGKRRRRQKRKKGRKMKKDRSKEEEGTGRRLKGTHEEVVTIPKEMSLLSRDDPAYGIAYYKAMRLDDISAVASKPILQMEIPAFRTALNDRIFPPTESMYGTRAAVYHIQTDSNTGELSPRTGMRCFGCGEIGHGVRICPAINELISKGEMKKDTTGRVTFGDGSPIQRTGWETFVQVHAREKSVRSLFGKGHRQVGKESKLGSKGRTVESDWRRIDEDSARREMMGDAYRMEAPNVAKRRRMFGGAHPPPRKILVETSMMTRQDADSKGEMSDAYRLEGPTVVKEHRSFEEYPPPQKILENSKVTRSLDMRPVNMHPMVSRETEGNSRGSDQGHIEEESDDAYLEFDDLRGLKGRHRTPETPDIMIERTEDSEPDESDTEQVWSLLSRGAECVKTQRGSEVLAGDEYRRKILPKEEIQAERNKTGREGDENGPKSGAGQEDRKENFDDMRGEEEFVGWSDRFVRRGQATVEDRIENLLGDVGKAIGELKVELLRMADEVRELQSRWDRLVGTQGTWSQPLAPRLSSTRQGLMNMGGRASREASDRFRQARGTASRHERRFNGEHVALGPGNRMLRPRLDDGAAGELDRDLRFAREEAKGEQFARRILRRDTDWSGEIRARRQLLGPGPSSSRGEMSETGDLASQETSNRLRQTGGQEIRHGGRIDEGCTALEPGFQMLRPEFDGKFAGELDLHHVLAQDGSEQLTHRILRERNVDLWSVDVRNQYPTLSRVLCEAVEQAKAGEDLRQELAIAQAQIGEANGSLPHKKTQASTRSVEDWIEAFRDLEHHGSGKSHIH